MSVIIILQCDLCGKTHLRRSSETKKEALFTLKLALKLCNEDGYICPDCDEQQQQTEEDNV